MVPENFYRDIPMFDRYIPFIASALYITAWFVREHMFAKEREGLIDRLMSKDIKEFKAVTAKEKVSPRSWGQLDDETLAELEEKQKAKILAGE